MNHNPARCAHLVHHDGNHGRGEGRRQCTRWPQAGGRYCGQHRPASDHLLYILSPYTDESMGVRTQRAQQAARYAAQAMAAGWNVFCPIAHGHAIDLHSPQPTGAEFWLSRCRWYLDRCTEAWVLTIDGWEESHGIGWEMTYLDHRGVDVMLADPYGEIPEGPLVEVGK